MLSASTFHTLSSTFLVARFRVWTQGLLLLLVFGQQTNAQNFPVQAFLQVAPPYSSYLPDYAQSSNNQMKVLLTLTDFTVPSQQVKVRLRFEGNGYSIENPAYLNLPPITLMPSAPFELSGADLIPYLSSNNLIFTGINVGDYEQRKVLPEGPCLICVEVREFGGVNESVLGNPTCTNVWFANYDPPYLNSPICGTETNVTDPQQLVFTWTPLNLITSTGIGNVAYVF
jgi:hypothetical protein